MSKVTNAILTFPLCKDEQEEEYIDLVNSFFKGCGFKRLDNPNSYGGTKVLEHNICVAAFNHLNEIDFIDHLKSIPFEQSSNVRLFLCRQEEDVFSMVPLT